MKKMKKALAVFVSFVLLAAVCVLPVYALDGMLGGNLTDLLNGLLNGNGNNNSSQDPVYFSQLLQNPGGILDAIRERLKEYDLGDVSNSDLVSAISKLLNGDTSLMQGLLSGELFDTSMIARLAQILNGGVTTTEVTLPPTTTLPSTTQSVLPGYEYSTYELPTYTMPSTNPIVIPPTSYSGADPYSTLPTVPSTLPIASATQIVTTPTYSQAPLTGATYVSESFSVYDYNQSTQKSDSGKMIAGAAIVAVALAAVVVVAIMLKKSRI